VVEVAEPGGAVWVHPSVVVRPSAIAGGGLHASAPLPAGVVVIRLGGRLVDTATLHGLFEHAPPGEYIDTFAVGDDVHLVLPPGTTAHYGNHSCEPTMWPVGAYELATCRAVAAGDELTVDYGLISDDATFRMDCHCGAARCRGVVTGADWRRADLQRRYAGHWPPGLQQRISRA
jgi:SET domain-containing protein